MSALFLGFLIDRLGPRTTLLAGGVLLALAMIGSAVASSWITLAVAQAFAGLAAGVMLPAIYAVATTTGSEEEGSRILGRVLTGWSVSLIAGVPLSALIADALGWEASFFALGGLVVASLMGFWMMPVASADPDREPAGGMLTAVALPGIAALLLAQFFFMTAFYGTYAFFGDHLREALGLSAGMAGLVVLFYGIGFGIAAVGDGIVDRIGPAVVLPFALAFVAGAYLVMPVLATWLIGAFVAAFVWGLPRRFGRLPLVLCASPTRDRDLGPHPTILLLAIDPEVGARLNADGLAMLGVLTEAEIEVCDLLVRGFETAAIAEHRETRAETTRDQIKAAAAKLACRSRLDILRLAMATTAPVRTPSQCHPPSGG